MAAALSAAAQFSNDGYYRVYNRGTKRYIYVYDCTGSINPATTSADMGAIQLWSGQEKLVTDPASVIYIKKINNYDQYDLMSQGTSVHGIINYYVTAKNYGTNSYTVSATEAGTTLYLIDAEMNETFERSNLTTVGSKSDIQEIYKRWAIEPISESNYLAVEPTLQVGNTYYQSYFVSFPYDTKLKSYYVSKIDKDYKVAVISEIDGTVPAATPVIVASTSASATDNRIVPVISNKTAIGNNNLKGVYFANQSRQNSSFARTVYDKSSMRILGKTSAGKLGFVIPTKDMLVSLRNAKKGTNELCVKPNTSYLNVSSDCPEELTVVTEQEYNDIIMGVHSISVDEVPVECYYTLSGVQIAQPVKGVNIVKYKNGTTDKIYIK